ncbi:hypothetical protein OG884_34220 [Streptosporangium sp. NBC_01755]|uniref:hypothetical protein n=1 Tax=unclassified Streptosporangium TaxID=2632669 RepID=UPI002DD85C3D|nr:MULTISPECIES: hypothetical protein [unclassified Streptosporangium]WSA28748.1 hypothetical protein OIE13_13240 [Streptosporangium sp. NBC_01810]WSC99799.1 hypothetical protein OG884_34220 [Streptosporangium sp. NBC_01755]
MNTGRRDVSGPLEKHSGSTKAARVRALLAVGAITGMALLATGAPASAVSVTTSEAGAHTVTARAGAVSRLPAGDDVYRDWFSSHSNCVAAGQGGIDRGHWEHYTCSEGDWFWHLWTNR